MAKYLDNTGVQTLWTAVKEQDATNLAAAKNYTDGKDNAMGSRVSTLEGYFTSGVANEAAKATKDGNNDVISSTYVKASTKGQANGVCPLDSNAKVAAAYLPGYVDDVIEGYYYQNKFYEESAHTTEITGEGGKLYVDLSSNTTYRWSGTQFSMVSESISIGTTQGTAYDGAAGATMRSDVDALQTAVNTTIPATYVPIDGSTAAATEFAGGAGTLYPKISNGSGSVALSSFRKVSDDTTHISKIDVKASEVDISSKYNTNSNESKIKVDPSSIYLISASLKWKTSSSATEKTIATTDDITINTFKINGTALTPSSKAIDIKTNGTYDASTNKIATMSDITVDSIETTGSGNAITSASLANKKITFSKDTTFLSTSDAASTYVPKQSTGTDRLALIQNANGQVSLQAIYKESNVNKRAGLIHLDTNNKCCPKLSWIDFEQSPQGGNDAANFKVNDNGIVAYINKTYMPNATFTYNGNEVATTNQIPSVEAISSSELAAILV